MYTAVSNSPGTLPRNCFSNIHFKCALPGSTTDGKASDNFKLIPDQLCDCHKPPLNSVFVTNMVHTNLGSVTARVLDICIFYRRAVPIRSFGS